MTLPHTWFITSVNNLLMSLSGGGSVNSPSGTGKLFCMSGCKTLKQVKSLQKTRKAAAAACPHVLHQIQSNYPPLLHPLVQKGHEMTTAILPNSRLHNCSPQTSVFHLRRDGGRENRWKMMLHLHDHSFQCKNITRRHWTDWSAVGEVFLFNSCDI